MNPADPELPRVLMLCISLFCQLVAVYLNGLDRALQAHGLTVLNLAPLLRRKADGYLKRGQYLYWPDHTHWNRNGIRGSVNAVVDWDSFAAVPHPR